MLSVSITKCRWFGIARPFGIARTPTKTLVLNRRLLSNGYIKVGVVIQHGNIMSFEYLFRPIKQYHRHGCFVQMGEQMSDLLSYIFLLFKIVLLQETNLV